MGQHRDSDPMLGAEPVRPTALLPAWGKRSFSRGAVRHQAPVLPVSLQSTEEQNAEVSSGANPFGHHQSRPWGDNGDQQMYPRFEGRARAVAAGGCSQTCSGCPLVGPRRCRPGVPPGDSSAATRAAEQPGCRLNSTEYCCSTWEAAGC